MGVIHLHVNTCAHADVPPSVSRKRLDGLRRICYVVGDPLPGRSTEVDDGVNPHVSTCAPLFRITETAGRIALKFGVWLRDQQ